MKYQHLAAIFLLASMLVCIVSGCFITNCPVGGKRSRGTNIGHMTTRQCSACGPKGIGSCFGPQICCGPQMGCHIDSRDNFVCQLEHTYPLPCENKGAISCGAGKLDGGQCATEGVCCSTDQCILDKRCKSSLDAPGLRAFYNSAASDFLSFKDGVLQTSLPGARDTVD